MAERRAVHALPDRRPAPPARMRCGVERSVATRGRLRKVRRSRGRAAMGSSPDGEVPSRAPGVLTHGGPHHGKKTGTRSNVATSTSACNAKPTFAKSPKRYWPGFSTSVFTGDATGVANEVDAASATAISSG